MYKYIHLTYCPRARSIMSGLYGYATYNPTVLGCCSRKTETKKKSGPPVFYKHEMFFLVRSARRRLRNICLHTS